MKAIRVHTFGGPEVLTLEDIPDPKPGAGQVVIRVQAIGVNPVDTYIRAGIYGNRTMPYIPGSDAAGTIEAVGPSIHQLKPGDRVYYYGPSAYSEKILASLDQVHPLPASLSFEQGAALGVPYATAFFALFLRGRAQEGEMVLIHGASGGVGTAALQLARAHKMKILATAGTPEGLALVKAEGAEHVFDHSSSDYLDQILKVTAGQGVPLILEMAAHINLGNSLKLLATRGRIVVIGSRGKVEIDARDTMSRNADIRGMSLLFVTKEEIAAIHAELGKGLASGALRPIIREKLPLAQAGKAHELVMASGSKGKIVLIP